MSNIDTLLNPPRWTNGSSGVFQYPLQINPNQIVTKYDLQVERVENGWIVTTKDNKRYLVLKPEEILQYLQQDIK